MARIKEVEIDGQHFRIASLTLSQVELMFPSDPAKLEEIKNLSSREHYKRAYQTVCMGLNNALPKDTPEESRWSNQTINDNLDMYTFGRLHDAVLEHSGLTTVKETREEGEKKAAVVM